MTMINPAYANPILALSNLLTAMNIPHTVNCLYEGLQIRFPWNDGDAICNKFSHGSINGCVETMGCPWDKGDVSCLSVEDAFVRFIEWYQEV